MREVDTPCRKTACQRALAYIRRPAVTFWGTITAIALYLLSLGPVFVLFWNLHLHGWIASGFGYFYAPLQWGCGKSDAFDRIMKQYLFFWLKRADLAHSAATDWNFPNEPPYFTEVASALLFAWLVWNVVRWANQWRAH